MRTSCEVVGWLMLEADRAEVLVREQNGRISAQAADASAFADQAIQTGAFRRAAPIIDPVTQETIGYDMQSLAAPWAAI